MNNIVCKNKIAFNIKWKKITTTERKTNISFDEKNLDWSKFLCRQDLKVSLYVCLLEFILLLFVANYETKVLDFKTSISFEMFLSKN